ncbi:MAG TPA: hypothetical protein VI457_04155 [Methylococcaceae bacterium]|nr:hypothetical protein [Methylococcaceae bacterium]
MDDNLGDIRSRLGEARAEKDALLDSAFIQTPEYQALLQQRSGYVVVGRRGTGKSALFRELKLAFAEQRNHRVISLEPDGNEVYPIHAIIRKLSSHDADYDALHEVATTLCRYAILLEVLNDYSASRTNGFSFLDTKDQELLGSQLTSWKQEGSGAFERLYCRVRPHLERQSDPGLLLGELNVDLQYRKLLHLLQQLLNANERPYALLADRLDEGFRPEDIGVAFINGIVSAATELSSAIPRLRATIFLRDNIFRAIQKKDRNYTRNIEGQVLRLHWATESLMQLVATRLRIAFRDGGSEQPHGERNGNPTDQATWSKHSTNEYRGIAGFRKVLELTLYRPRDLITLLNIAFFEAAKRGSERISPHDVAKSAEEVSRVRLEDLIKEYADAIPGLSEILNALSISRAHMQTPFARSLIESVAINTSSDRTAETIRLLGSAGILYELHSIGFLGYGDKSDGRFTFCHDGRLANIDFGADVELMIHPCYWRAINAVGTDGMAPEVAEEIHDDYNERYEVNVTSVATERRKEVIQRLVSEAESLPKGSNDEGFYAWAARALGTLLASGIRDLERQSDLLHGRITSTKGMWGIVQDIRHTNHLLFLLRNEDKLTVQAITEACSRAKKTRDSRVIFVCTRAAEAVIRRGPELEAVKQHYSDNGLIVAHITEKTICRSLRKLRDPTSDGEPGRFIVSAIDQTVYSYLQSRKREPRKERGNRSVGVACNLLLVVATTIERDAVLDQFRNEHGCTIDEVFAHRRTYFKISGIAESKILLVQCEIGSGGVGASQATVRDAIDDLNPGSIVMVGVAFGMKPDTQEIGQVLVSKQLRPYEMQRIGTVDGGAVYTPRGDQVTASSKLLSKFRAVEYSWSGKVSFGLLLSGEKLIDNRDYRESLAKQEPEAIGGEMEGTGLYAAAADLGKDWIIVKGICDWADGKKNDNKDALQREAAAKSAAFVIHAILRGAFSQQNRVAKH